MANKMHLYENESIMEIALSFTQGDTFEHEGYFYRVSRIVDRVSQTLNLAIVENISKSRGL